MKIALKLIALALLFFAHLKLISWVEQMYLWEKSDYPWVAAMLMTITPFLLTVALFYPALKKNWQIKKMSAIFLTLIVFLVGTLGTRALMQLNGFIRVEHEMSVLLTLRELYRAESEFKKQHNKFANLPELVEAELIQPNYVSAENGLGYKFSDTDISADTFCIHADRIKNGTGNRDFNLTESGAIRFIATRMKGTVPCGAGAILADISR